MLGFKQIDEADITVPDLYTNDWKPHNWNLRPWKHIQFMLYSWSIIKSKCKKRGICW